MQSMIVLALAALAAAYLAWHVIGPFVSHAGEASGCHGCAAACPAKAASAAGRHGRTVVWMRQGGATRGRPNQSVGREFPSGRTSRS